MNIRMLWTAAAALTVALSIAGPARADDPTPTPAAPAKKYTAEEKAAQRAARKAETAEAKKTGTLPAKGEAAPTMAEKASGTHETRKAARKEHRKEVASEAKKGEIKNPGEAGEPKK